MILLKHKLANIQDILVELENKEVIQCDVKCKSKEDGYLTYVEISIIENDSIKSKRMVTGRGCNADTTTLQIEGIVSSLKKEGYLQVRVA